MKLGEITVFPRCMMIITTSRFRTWSVVSMSSFMSISYYTNIKRYINQREFGSFNANLSRANKCSV